MNLKISDFVIEIQNKDERIEQMFERKGCMTGDSPDYSFTVTDDEMAEDISKLGSEQFKSRVLGIAIHRKIAEWLPQNGAFLLHSACFEVNGSGVAFAAHSGTGKTTHMLLWQRLLGEKMTVVNGDKPIIRYFENEPQVPYAYGTPWNGKERLGCNMRTPLRHICFIERSDKNYCEPITKSEAINPILNQVYMPKNPVAMSQTLALTDRLLSDCRLWRIHCNMEPEAAEVSYKTIFGEL